MKRDPWLFGGLALMFAWAPATGAPLFQANFEKSLDATTSGGSPAAKSEGEVEYIPGIDGLAAVLGNRSRLQYASAGNIRLEAGTILLWVKPLNWSWQAGEFMEFFRLDSPADRSSLLLYKFQKPSADFGLVWLAGHQRKSEGKPEWTIAKKRLSFRDDQGWRLLAATWDRASRLINLYVDGEAIAYATLPQEQFPSTLAEQFFVLNTVKQPLDDKFRTAVDSLTIEDRALSAEEIRSYFERSRPAPAEAAGLTAKAVPPSFLTIPYLATPPVIDGHYGADEWSEAATASGFSVFAHPQTPPDKQTVAHIGYDDKNLYVAWLTPIPPGKPPIANAETFDDLRVGRDDAVELILSSPRGEIYQWLVNTRDVSADLKGAHFAKLDPAWNSQAKISGKIYEARWLCEMAIPLSDLEGGLGDGKGWKINFCRDWAQAAASGGTLSTSWSFAPKSFAGDLGRADFQAKGVSAGLQLDAKALESRQLSGQWQLRNSSQAPAELKVISEVTTASGELLRSDNRSVPVAPGQYLQFPFDLLVEAPVTLGRFRVTDQEGTEIFSHAVPLVYPAGMVVSPLVRADTRSVEVNVQLGATLPEEQKAAARVLLKDESGKVLGSAPLELSKNRASARGVLDLAEIEDGTYDLVAELEIEGEPAKTAAKRFEKMLNPVWLREKPGISRRIPPPWTPVTFQDNRISCWGRVYEFGDSLLPVQILSAGEKLLTAPASIALESSRGGAFGPVTYSPPQVSEDQVILLAEQQNESFTVQARTTIEFDGMAKVELTVKPKTPEATLDRLQLHFPLRDFREPLLHAHSFAWSDMVRERLPAEFVGKFFPYCWIGSEARGLAWFAESDRQWQNADPERVNVISRGGQSIDWRISLVDRPTALSEPVTYVFGFQATPVKPPIANRRALRLHQPGMTHILPWAMRNKAVKKYQAEDKEWGWLAPHVGDYEGFREEIDFWRAKGISLPVYVAPTITSPLSPSYQLFKESWRNPHGSYPFACAAATFTDELIWNVDQMIKKSGMESIYIDCAWAYSCGNRGHGCGYQSPDGKVRLTYPIFALREELKRIYQLIHHPKSSPRALVWAHASGLAAAPIHSFVDVLTQGEEVRTEITANPDYFASYTLDTWRITYGPALGIEMNFLPEFADPSIKAARYDANRNAGFVAFALLHDTSVQDGFSDPAYLRKVYESLDREGFREDALRFLPYWQQRAVVSAKPEVKVSLYTLPKHALAVLVNPSEQTVQTRLKIQASELGWPPGAVTAVEIFPSAQELDATGPVEIPPKNFVILKLIPDSTAN
jgi:hypothetical protein